MIRLLIPLQSYRDCYGATAVVPGSHEITDEAALKKHAIDLSVCEDGSVGVEIGWGDVLAMHPKTIHGSALNESRYRRDQLVVQLAVGSAEYSSNLQLGSSEPFYMSERIVMCAYKQ